MAVNICFYVVQRFKRVLVYREILIIDWSEVVTVLNIKYYGDGVNKFKYFLFLAEEGTWYLSTLWTKLI